MNLRRTLAAAAITAAFAAPLNAQQYDSLYKKHADEQELDWRLVKAIGRIESNHNPRAINENIARPGWPSYGLLQVLCQPDGFSGCSNKLDVVHWPPDNYRRLLDPDYNLHIATQILSWNISQYGLVKGIAVYNDYSARFSPSKGPFPNQRYVDMVLREYRKLVFPEEKEQSK